MSDRAARIAEHVLGSHERPEPECPVCKVFEIRCSRCGFTPVLTGDRHTDGGTLIDHMESAHTPHAVPRLASPMEGKEQ